MLAFFFFSVHHLCIFSASPHGFKITAMVPSITSSFKNITIGMTQEGKGAFYELG
jgi:hypothetical protein